MKVWPGVPYPLGATFDGGGTNFSIFSQVADRVELCLFDEQRTETRVEVKEAMGFCHHVYIPGIQPGQRFGWRIYGPWDPANGQRCNGAKLLLDPYAKAFDGGVKWDEAVFSYQFSGGDLVINETDSAPFVPLAVVHQPWYDWTGDRRLQIPWNKTLIYEMHVKGFTAKHPDIPEDIRGTYAAIAHPVTLEYLKQLGITAVELMPIHQFVHDKHLVDRGSRNYWGYNSIGYFAPHNEYAADQNPGNVIAEFKNMVKALHKEGIEVILDVVYNHTAEGNQMGPTLSFRGIDNEYYYRLTQNKRYYMDYTGTGNSLHMRNPHVLQLIMDSLRYWVTEMHVDGFRFDLAATLARELKDVDRLSVFFDLIQQDPVVSQVKLIAEPWDVGDGGYQVGNFPPVWSEWNGKFRDSVRNFWRGEHRTLGEFASRIAGSSDLYENTARLPFASINLITAHDGFTLDDVVSYNEKHNDANGEGNRDGTNDNCSWNMGVEGPTENPDILALRSRQKRNLLATLMLSQGVAMILAGDEIGRTQHGNNNPYCQDNDISWQDWTNTDQELLSFTRRLTSFCRMHPVFSRRGWFFGRNVLDPKNTDIAWFTIGGAHMQEQNWHDEFALTLCLFLNGEVIPNPNPKGDPVTDKTFYLVYNAYSEDVICKLPPAMWGQGWTKEMDTAVGWLTDEQPMPAEAEFSVTSRSLVVLSRAT